MGSLAVALTGHELGEFFRQKGKVFTFRAGQVVFMAGEESNRVFFILRGRVKIYRLTPSGSSVTVSIRHPGEIFGLAEVLGGSERVCFAEALEELEVAGLKNKDFETMLLDNPVFAGTIAIILAKRLREAETIIYEMVCYQAPSRLAHLLLKLAGCCGQAEPNPAVSQLKSQRIKLGIRLSHREIAEMIGSSRQTVTSILNAMVREKAIDMRYKEIIVLDRKKLERWLVV
ncbi:Crp/Fnr family transcriptional regulator [Moorella naiadis]|uniref:Crp/Fnr family transcriptional regulator n=1 Tax=Moorella naiadis (nom. illeg.) TaxID=3093670 RepID=UPI003D9CAF93